MKLTKGFCCLLNLHLSAIDEYFSQKLTVKIGIMRSGVENAAWKFHYPMKTEKSDANEANCVEKFKRSSLSDCN